MLCKIEKLLTETKLNLLNRGFPTSGTRTTGGTRKLFKWYARHFSKMQKEFVFAESSQKLFYFTTEVSYTKIG